MAPTSVAIDLGPLQQRNKREILGNMLNWPSSRMSGLMWPPLAKCLDLPVLAVNPGVEIQIPASIESYFRIWFGTRVGLVCVYIRFIRKNIGRQTATRIHEQKLNTR